MQEIVSLWKEAKNDHTKKVEAWFSVWSFWQYFGFIFDFRAILL